MLLRDHPSDACYHEFQWSVYPALQGELFVIDGENKKSEKVKERTSVETFKSRDLERDDLDRRDIQR